MKNRKNLKKKLGIVLVIFALLFFCDNGYLTCILDILCFAIAILFLPLFDILCKKVNCSFSKSRKKALGTATFLIPLFCISVNNPTLKDVIITLLIILIIWFVSFSTNEKKYGEENLKRENV